MQMTISTIPIPTAVTLPSMLCRPLVHGLFSRSPWSLIQVREHGWYPSGCKWFITMVVRGCHLEGSGWTGPLPNGRKLAYKWGVYKAFLRETNGYKAIFPGGHVGGNRLISHSYTLPEN